MTNSLEESFQILDYKKNKLFDILKLFSLSYLKNDFL